MGGARAVAAAVLLLAALLSGCAGIDDLRSTEDFLAPWARGDYAGAAAAIGGADGLDYDADNLLLSLHAGSALRATGAFEASQTAYDRAESRLLWKSDEIADAGDLLEAGFTLVASDLARDYPGAIRDGVLVNTYKALNALSLGDEARARVELNRADQRQGNAIDQLAAKVAALGADSPDGEDARDRAIANRARREVLEPGGAAARRLAAVRALGAYRDLRNPFTDWLHGVFRLATGEANRASDLLRNAAALDGERNRHVLEDFRIAEEAAGALSAAAGRVWVVHEDGIGPRLDEFRFDLPIVTDTGLFYAGIALPDFAVGVPGVGGLAVEADGRRHATETLLDMDRYAATEFEAGYDAIVAKAVAAAVVKAVAQFAVREAVREQDAGIVGSLLEIGAAVAAAATTQADTRIWRSLPKTIGVASLPRPADGKLRVAIASGGALADIVLPEREFAIVWVRTVAPGAPAAVHAAGIGGAPVAAAERRLARRTPE